MVFRYSSYSPPEPLQLLRRLYSSDLRPPTHYFHPITLSKTLTFSITTTVRYWGRHRLMTEGSPSTLPLTVAPPISGHLGPRLTMYLSLGGSSYRPRPPLLLLLSFVPDVPSHWSYRHLISVVLTPRPSTFSAFPLPETFLCSYLP